MEEKVIIKNNSKPKNNSTKSVIQAPTKKQESTIDKSNLKEIKVATSDKKVIVKGNPKPIIQVLPKEQKSITEESKVATSEKKIIFKGNLKPEISTKPVIQAPTKKQDSNIDKSKVVTSDKKEIVKGNTKPEMSTNKSVIRALIKKLKSTINKSKVATSDKKIIIKSSSKAKISSTKPVIQAPTKEQKSITDESKREEINVTLMDDELIIQSNPKSRISEAIKSIKTNLQFTAIDQNIKTLMITSSVPGEGKSFIAANLACAFANSEVKVLLIDCDLRKGRQHQIFKVSNAKGLSNLLIDDISIRQNYIKDTKIKNVKILPSGVIPPNPSELLGSKKNKKLIEALEKDFDLIILDCPPVNGLADALVMTSLVDSVIIVCAQNRTKTSLLNETKKALGQLNAKVTGVIMNRVDVKETDDYYRYYE